MKIVKYLLLMFICMISLNSFAADQAIKEDFTPPAAEGPITADQIPPMASSTTPQQPVMTT